MSGPLGVVELTDETTYTWRSKAEAGMWVKNGSKELQASVEFFEVLHWAVHEGEG